MFARVSTFRGSPEQEAETLAGPVPDEVQAMPGFKGAYALANRETGKAMLITLWETEEAMKATAERAKQIRQDAVAGSGGTQPAEVETYDVMAQT